MYEHLNRLTEATTLFGRAHIAVSEAMHEHSTASAALNKSITVTNQGPGSIDLSQFKEFMVSLAQQNDVLAQRIGATFQEMELANSIYASNLSLAIASIGKLASEFPDNALAMRDSLNAGIGKEHTAVQEWMSFKNSLLDLKNASPIIHSSCDAVAEKLDKTIALTDRFVVMAQRIVNALNEAL